MAGSLRHYFSLLYGSTEQDDSESTDKHTPIDCHEDVDPIGFTDEEEIQNSVPDNKARNYSKSSPFEVDASVDEQIQCQICRKQFQNQNTLQNHLDMHILYSHNQCAFCCKVFSLKKNLRRHEASIHFIDSGIYRCLTCPKIFPDLDILGNHTIMCRSRKPKCYMCSVELESFDDLSAHQENKHNLRGYVCGFCATSLPTEEKLCTHLKCCKKASGGEENERTKHLKCCKKAPVGEENECSKDLKCCKKAPVGENNKCSKQLKCCKKAPVGEENEWSKHLKCCKKAPVGEENEWSKHLKCCKKAPVGENNKCSKHLKFCKKTVVAKENNCSNIKKASSIQSEIKMSQFEAFNAMPKMKGSKRKAGNDLEKYEKACLRLS